MLKELLNKPRPFHGSIYRVICQPRGICHVTVLGAKSTLWGLGTEMGIWPLTQPARGQVSLKHKSICFQNLGRLGSKHINGCCEQVPSWGYGNHRHVLDIHWKVYGCMEIFFQVTRTLKETCNISLGLHKITQFLSLLRTLISLYISHTNPN